MKAFPFLTALQVVVAMSLSAQGASFPASRTAVPPRHRAVLAGHEQDAQAACARHGSSTTRHSSFAARHTPIPDPRPLTPGCDDGEFLIDTSVAYRPSLGCDPSIAFDGGNYLVVWSWCGPSTMYTLWATRVSQAGVVLDSAGIPVSIDYGHAWGGAVAFDGSNYLVVWVNTRSGAQEIRGRRVSPGGQVVDTNAVLISRTSTGSIWPSVAAGTENLLVVWQTYGCDLWGARISRGGEVLDSIPIMVTSELHEAWPAVTFDGANYLVVWQESAAYRTPDIRGARISQTGEVLDPGGFVISAAPDRQWTPSVECLDSTCLVVWSDRRNGMWDDIFGARITRNGVVLDPSGIPISSDTLNYQAYPALASDGTNWLVGWVDSRNGFGDIYCSRVSGAGRVLDRGGRAVTADSGSSEQPSFGGSDLGFLTVWVDEYPTYSGLLGARISPEGTRQDTDNIHVAMAANRQCLPAAAFDGSNFLVVWQDEGESSGEVRGMRISAEGVALDPAPLIVSATEHEYTHPAVTASQFGFFVVWDDGPEGRSGYIYGSRISPQGEVLDPGGFAISTAPGGQWGAKASFDDVNYLVVWNDSRSPPGLYGARVTPDGIVLNPDGIPIDTIISEGDAAPAVAFDGINYLVAYSGYGPGCLDLYAKRLAPSGVVLDSVGFTIAASEDHEFVGGLAFNGENYLVTWCCDAWPGYQVWGARLTPQGIVLDTIHITSTSEQGYIDYCTVARDENNWLVASLRCEPYATSELSGAIITGTGVVDTFALVPQITPYLGIALAPGANRRVLLALSQWTPTIGHKSYNTYRIWGKLGPFPGVAEKSSQPTAHRLQLSAYPNPFRDRISLQLTANSSQPRIRIYDISGQLVRAFDLKGVGQSEGHKALRPYCDDCRTVTWDGCDDAGRKLPSGVYLVRLDTGGAVGACSRTPVTKQLMLVQ